jgi:flagellar basal-body rod modification protein FlgD
MTMTVKTGIKPFVDRKVNGADPIKNTNPSGGSDLSPDELKKLGGDNIGEVLNKMSDPGWTDPNKKMRATGNDMLDKDAFMKLMLTQMKNQDPTNPLQSHEMAAQLASFTSLEQLQNINSTLEQLKRGQEPTANFQALGLIGKAVSGDSAQVTRSPGDKEHEFKFTLPEKASDVLVKIRNAEGDIIRTFNMKDLKAGANQLTWNGMDEHEMAAPAGEYQFFAEAKTTSGKKLALDTKFEGIISGVNYTAQGPVMMVGGKSIKLSDLKKISDPSLMKNDQIVNEVKAQDLKKSEPKSDNEKESSAKEASAKKPKGNLANVKMAGEVIDKIAKGKEASL